MRYLVIRNGIIENAIEYDGGNWPIPEGYELIQSDSGEIGETYGEKNGTN